jgi:uncharacterized protein YndB with AHSA1/START domain
MSTSYESLDGRPALRFDRRIAHPVTAVWAALTEPEQLGEWFPSAVAGELRPGGRLTFTFVGRDLPPMDGEVTAFEPPSALEFSWGGDRLRFELTPAEGGAETELRFTVLLDAADKAARDGAGWDVCLDQLGAVLDGADEQARDAIARRWRAYYDEYAGRGFPATAPIPETPSGSPRV